MPRWNFRDRRAGERIRDGASSPTTLHTVWTCSLAAHSYDVVLMNPPFGAMPTSMLPYITENYPESRNDIYACFVARAAELLDGLGQIGQITSSTCLSLDHLSDWRQQFFFGRTRLGVLADLGSGVLDGQR